jgi:erythromycin esterase
VEAYLRTADPVAADSAASRYACFRKYQDNTQGVEPNYTIAPPAVRDECRRGVTAVWTALSEARGRYAAAGFGAGYERALRGARVAQQNEEQRASTQSTGLRDRAMAENAAWLLQQAGPSARMVVWAHNFHVSHDAGAMGSVLSTQFGSGMVNVGFLFGHGGFNAVEQDASGNSVALRALSADRASAGTYEYELQRLALPRMILDLRSVPAGGATAWLQGPRLMREIGAVYSPSQPSRFFQQVNLPQRFDVVIWFDEVHPSTLLPFD